MTIRLPVLFCIFINAGLSKPKVQPEIVTLGNTISEQLADQTKENAELLNKNLSTYLKLLQEISDLIWSPNGEIVSKGMGIFDALEEAGGPPHVTKDLDYKLLEDKYNWTEEEVNEFKKSVDDTKVLWELVKDRANRLRIGTWGVDSKVEDEAALPDGQEDSDGDLH